MAREDRSERLAHLSGYAAIAAVLASATWSSPTGMALGYGFAIIVSIMLLEEGVRRFIRLTLPAVAWTVGKVRGAVSR